MRKIKEVLRLHFESHMSIRRIAASCSLSRSAVSDMIARAIAAKVSWPPPGELGDSELEALLYPQPLGRRAKPDSVKMDMPYIQRELSRKGVTLQLLWTEYIAQNPGGYQYSRFCELYREWQKSAEPSLHQDHKAGEKMMVDWAGQTITITDRETGELVDARIFVATLPASNYLYVEPFASMALENWIAGHVHAFEFFASVPEIIVPDNTKTAVSKYCYYEPELNATYADMARYYGAAVVPARPARPKDKANVECHVGITSRAILAPLRNHRFFHVAEAREAIFEQLDRVNAKPFQKLPGSRLSTFLEIERDALKPLPERRYELAYFMTAKVSIDCHFEVLKNWYSAPKHLMGKNVDVRYTATTVEALHDGKRVAIHARTMKRGKHVTKEEHLPKEQREYANWSPARLIGWARTIGPNTAAFIEKMLQSRPHPMMAYRSCLGVLRLSRTYPPERVEAACTRALQANAFNYKSVKAILEKGLDRVDFDKAVSSSPVSHPNIRGAAYYSDTGGDEHAHTADHRGLEEPTPAGNGPGLRRADG